MQFQPPQIPENLSTVVDMYRQYRDIRLAMDKEVAAVKEYENALKQHLIDNIPKDSAGVFGLLYKAQITMKPTATVSKDGWPALMQFIKENDRLDLIQKRLSATAAMDMMDQGITIPGVEKFNVVDVSVTKV